MTEHDDDRLAVEKAQPKSSAAVPDEDELSRTRASRQGSRSDEERQADDAEIDEALEETFPASDPPSYSKGLPKTE
ncbi:MAG TPA: hypothetical protein VKV69_05620 [Actinomycetota bacterium]|nr:hypothetical protein [Actinomycetota bacterium]